MVTLDISVVGLALPVLARDFHAPLTTLAWVVLAYVLVISGLLLLFGRLADRAGRRRLYAGGLAIFVAASLGCAAAPGVAWLIAARALQGLGAAMMSANSAALLVAAFPSAERGRALGAFGAAVGIGLALGPPIGGWIVDALSWRWIFLVNLPLGLLALLLVRSRVPPDVPPAPESAAVEAPAAPGFALWSLGLVLVMLALSLAPERGWRDGWVMGSAAGGAVLLAAFAMTERIARRPLLPWAHLRGPLGAALALTVAGQAISMAAGVLLPLQLEEVARFEPGRAGRWLALLPLAAMVATPLAGRWADRVGPRLLSIAGLVLVAVGAALLSQLGLSARGLLPGGLLFGAGLGLFTAPNASAVMGAVPPELLGSASGLQATARNLGIAGGTAAATTVVATLYAAAAHAPLLGGPGGIGRDPGHLSRAIGFAFWGLAAAAVAAAGFAALAPRPPARAGT